MASADYEGTAKTPFPPRVNFSRFNVVARYPNPAIAEQVLEQLRASGVPRGEASILGEEQDMVRPESGLSIADEKVVKAVAANAFIWAAAGGVFGIVVGIVRMLIPAFRHTVHAQVDAPALLSAALIGALLGGMGAYLVGYVAGLDSRFSETETYGDQVAMGTTLVGVHTESPEDTSAVSAKLQAAGALSVEAYAPPVRAGG
jgi:hypothetical protein